MILSISSDMAKYKEVLGPDIPVLVITFALDTSWQGKPPINISIFNTLLAKSPINSSSTEVYMGVFGYFDLMNLILSGFDSQKNAISILLPNAFDKPISRPRIPENKDPTLYFRLLLPEDLEFFARLNAIIENNVT